MKRAGLGLKVVNPRKFTGNDLTNELRQDGLADVFDDVKRLEVKVSASVLQVDPLTLEGGVVLLHLLLGRLGLSVGLFQLHNVVFKGPNRNGLRARRAVTGADLFVVDAPLVALFLFYNRSEVSVHNIGPTVGPRHVHCRTRFDDAKPVTDLCRGNLAAQAQGRCNLWRESAFVVGTAC